MAFGESLHTILAFLFGALLAAAANYLADRWGWTQRYRSPWRRLPAGNAAARRPERSLYDYVPILGWATLARFTFKRRSSKRRDDYSAIPGWESRFFWLRGLATEALFAALIAYRFAYWRAEPYAGVSSWLVETSFFWFLLVASLVDLDDFIIPDAITIVATLTALVVAWFAPGAVLIVATLFPYDMHMTATTPLFTEWTSTLAARRFAVTPALATFVPLALIWSFWAFALLDRRFYLRLGLRRAFALFWRRLVRSSLTRWVGAIWAVGLAALYAIIFRAFSLGDSALVSVNVLALVFLGLFFGVLLIWTVRIVGGSALGMEAMGFGDVILGGVIGAYLGWQGVLVVFFLAPFFGLFFGVLRRGFQAEREIPYGPFLALGSVIYSVWRLEFNELLSPLFDDLAFLATLGAGGLVLFVVLLTALRLFKEFRARVGR